MKHQDQLFLNTPVSLWNLVLNDLKTGQNRLFLIIFGTFWTYLRVPHGGPNDLRLKVISSVVKHAHGRPLGAEITLFARPLAGLPCGAKLVCSRAVDDYLLMGLPGGVRPINKGQGPIFTSSKFPKGQGNFFLIIEGSREQSSLPLKLPKVTPIHMGSSALDLK